VTRRQISGWVLFGAVWLSFPAAAADEQPFAKGPPIASAPAVAAPAGAVPLTAEQQAALEQMSDIRDIRPPVPYGWDPRWGVGAAVAALLAAGAGLLWWLRRRRQPAAPRAAAVPPVPLEHVARGELAALAQEAGLPDKEFYFRLCTAVRRYLDGRYGVDTLERTTEELVPVLRGLPLDEGTRGALVTLFRRADPVRYADAAAPGEERRADLAAARALMQPSSAGEGA